MTVGELRAKIRSAADKMRADDNTKNALRYLEHLTWLLFLRVFEAVEDERELVAKVDARPYTRIIEDEYRWSKWTTSGSTGDDLTKWVSESLLPHLRGLAGSREAEKIGLLFAGVTTVMKSGYSLAEVVAIVNEIDFHGLRDYHAMSVIYESLLQEQTSDAGWSGEFYTPRPVVEFMVNVISPSIGETVYDPCHGSAGFLVATADYLRPQAETTEQEEMLSTATVFGQESGDLAYLVGTMNLLLHGISAPQTIRRNTLEQDVRGIGPSEQHDIILTNPPFGGTEHLSVQQNFPARSAATEVLFLQHVMAKLKPTGRAAVVLPDALLSREDASYVWVRRRLVTEFNLHAIVRLPSGAFFNAPGTRANLVFFSGSETERPENIRFYQVHPPTGKPAFGKGDPIGPEHLERAFAWLTRGDADGSAWEIPVDRIDTASFGLKIIPRLQRVQLQIDDPAQQLELLISDADAVADSARAVEAAATEITSFETTGQLGLVEYVEERGERAGSTVPERFIGVSNEDGLVPFKGRPAKDTRKYRRVEVGDFVYNPMRINVGSLALCREPDEEGWASPDYVVFSLLDNAPFGREYLLRFLKGPAGRAEIDRHTEGSVRARLYYENLCDVEVPVPADPEHWEALLRSIESLRRHLRDGVGGRALTALEGALFAGESEPASASVQA